MDKINVLIADDHPIFRLGLVNVIKSAAQLNLVGEAENGTVAVDLIYRLKPDVAVLDLEMPGLNGLQVCEKICGEKTNKTKVLILTLLKEADLYLKSMEIGAFGYLLKDNAAEELAIAIEKVHNGDKYVSVGLNEKLNSKKSYLLNDQKFKEILTKLTSTEISILKLISEQKTTKEISQKLFVSEKTTENHRYNINKKLGLGSGQNSLLIFALENKDYW